MDVIYMSCTAFDPKCLNTDIQAKKKKKIMCAEVKVLKYKKIVIQPGFPTSFDLPVVIFMLLHHCERTANRHRCKQTSLLQKYFHFTLIYNRVTDPSHRFTKAG